MDFKQPYNSHEFVNFLNTFLPDDFEKTEENIKLNDLSFNPDRIKNVKLVGNVSSLENLRIYEIYHESENDPKVTLSRETFRLMSNYGVKKALAAFTSRNSPNYRFSLVAIDLKLEGARVTREYSNPRRYSFYLGPAAKVHTPTEFLIKKGKIKDLKDLQNRFSVEVVTKAFFTELSNWYFWALKYVIFPKDAEKDKNGKNMAVIRLITRLIFIWFMKHKELIPNYLFNENEIKNILKGISPDESTYYRAILQNLFFASLNTPQNERRFRTEKRFYKGYNPDFGDSGIYRYQSYFREPPNIIDYFNEIPFLNGGLFECLDRKEEKIYIDGFTDVKKNQPIVPNFLFFSKEKEVNLNKEYGTKEKKSIVRGLLSLLQLYNFTIDESTPVDIEIALDPELLGRVFENLLASYNPETATTARKATGSYYTPRAIVDYMVTQSLKEYFKTRLMDVADIDSKIDNILSYDSEENPFTDEETNTLIRLINELKIIDPAVGSGAFPMGILHKLVLILSKLDPHNRKWKQQQIEAIDKNVSDVVLKKELIEKVEQTFQTNELNYGRKLYLIQNCIYGVDIQPIATQIAKLRFFISLLVDEKMDKSQDNFGIEPLPNLETKFVSANSLIGFETQEILRSQDVADLENELKKVRDMYFSASYNREKEKLKNKDKEIRQKLSLLLKQSGFPTENTEKIANWDPYNTNNSAGWFDSEWMFGIKDGFDIVIANPPYIKEYTNRKAFDGLITSPYYQGKMDIWYLFACRGIDSLRKNTGLLTFIAQNNWVTSYGASKMRNKVTQDTKIRALFDFGDYKIFETSGIQTMIMIFKLDSSSDNYVFDYRKLIEKNLNFEDILDLLNKKPNSRAEYLTPVIQRSKYIDKPLTFSDLNIETVLNKLSEQSNFKLRENEVAQGIVVPQEYVIKSHLKKLPHLTLGDGIFVLSDKEKNSIPFTKEELELIKPSYTTKELGRYYANRKNSEWVIYTDSKFKYPENIKSCPNIKKHLDKFQKVITSDNKPYGLHRARNEYFFKGEKIIAVRKCIEPTFTYTDFDCYVSATFYVIKTEKVNLKYLTALLNSKLIALWLKHKGKMQGNNYQIDKEPLLALPLKNISNAGQKPLMILVDNILTITTENDYLHNSSKQAKVKEYEHQIDQMVYELYGLTEDEIKIVEESVKPTKVSKKRNNHAK